MLPSILASLVAGPQASLGVTDMRLVFGKAARLLSELAMQALAKAKTKLLSIVENFLEPNRLRISISMHVQMGRRTK